MKTLLLTFTTGIALLAFTGCMSTGATTEHQAMSGEFAKYSNVKITFKTTEDDEKERVYQREYAKHLKAELLARKLFKNVVTEGAADLTIVSTITSVDAPSVLLNFMSKGKQNAVAKVDVKFLAGNEGRNLAALEVEGNSTRRTRSSINGVTITSSNDLAIASVQEAAVQVAEYIANNYDAQAKAAAKEKQK